MNEALEFIAREHLGIDSLEAKSKDHLQASKSAVWKIKDALEAAYRAGQEAAEKDAAE